MSVAASATASKVSTFFIATLQGHQRDVAGRLS
jgi:hypothetical protein